MLGGGEVVPDLAVVAPVVIRSLISRVWPGRLSTTVPGGVCDIQIWYDGSPAATQVGIPIK
jgi:hypothetical protein